MFHCVFVRCATQQSNIHRRPGGHAAAECVGSPLQQVRTVDRPPVRLVGGCDQIPSSSIPCSQLLRDLLCQVDFICVSYCGPPTAGTEGDQLSTTCTFATRARLRLRNWRNGASLSWTCLSG